MTVLFAGGTGSVGRPALRWFRKRHPDRAVLVGGRNLEAAGELARELGMAEPVAIDLDRPRLGLDRKVTAVVMVAPDHGLRGFEYAQELGVPYVNISTGLTEVGAELALFAHRPSAAPIVLASHWMGGASLFLALHAAKRFERVHAIRFGAIYDEKDPAGPAALEDMKRVHDAAPAALAFEDGGRAWLTGEKAKGKVHAVDGRTLEADAFSTLDVPSLRAATGAPDIRFDLLTGESSSRRRGGKPSAEIVVDIDGDVSGEKTHVRSTLEFEAGGASLTALSVVLLLAKPPTRPGLYLPENVLDAGEALEALRAEGAKLGT